MRSFPRSFRSGFPFRLSLVVLTQALLTPALWGREPSESPQSALPKAAAESGATKPSLPGAGAESKSPTLPNKALGFRNSAPPAPPPSKKQLRALKLLEQEAQDFVSGAERYRDSLTRVTVHHFADRRRRIAQTYDRRIRLEREKLVAAREETIQRLEGFVARYSGENADLQATPHAMFRLAALYEERVRSDPKAELNAGLQLAVSLYRKIIAQFPEYDEAAAVHYYLGHALTDQGRLEEAQQTWRALVCANRFKVRAAPGDERKLKVDPLPQDHDERFWNDWYNRHPLPLDKAGPSVADRKLRGAAAEELSFVDPYAECEPIPQKTEPGVEPRYVAEVWWQLGNFHFDQLDAGGGPYNLNRAVSAYEHSLKLKKPPILGVALYKQAWAFYKQQRYHAAVDTFVKLLEYADAEERRSGDRGADFRREAYTYIAGSLAYVDFEGPPRDDPYIPRSDVLDVETDPLVAEERMRVAIERVQDPRLIPQDRKWTVEIYKALAQEFVEVTQNRNAIATLELTLQKFPTDRDAPLMQSKVADLYDALSRLAPDGSSAKAEYAERALRARTELANYVGRTRWTLANKDDPDALDEAERLVRGGLKRAAADHTNQARALFDKAKSLSDFKERIALTEKALSEYRLADKGWAAYISQDPTALDAYESRFWLADARYWTVALQVELDRSPSSEDIQRAVQAATAVRDSNEDDKFVQPAAYYLVDLSEKLLEDADRVYRASGGQRGLPKRTAVKFVSQNGTKKVERAEIPDLVERAIRARDEYIARVPLERDPEKNGLLYSFQAADYYFVYGHFDEARKRLKPLYDEYCGRNKWGYLAWEKLISMSNFEADSKQSRALAEGKSCAFNEETRLAEEQLRKPVKQGVAYMDARALYEAAAKLPEGPERKRKWREAAAAYKLALDAAPDRDEAPEAAMNGAYAYKQVGEYDQAIDMYELFIDRYGDESTLARLQRGAPNAQPPEPAQPEKYQERISFLKSAYDALAGAYVLFFDYPKAAETFDRIANIQHFSPEARRSAAKQALALYASLDDYSGMDRARQRIYKLDPSPKEVAEADFIGATAALKQWDELSPSTGRNAKARVRAEAAMTRYFRRYKGKPGAERFVVQAAYYVAKTRVAVRAGDAEDWWRETTAAFERFRRVASIENGVSEALGSAEANMAAEAEYTLIDSKLRAEFDYESGFHRYRGTAVEVIQKFQKDAIDARKWYDRLQRVADTYASPKWTAVAVARQGALYDSLRTGLYNTRPPALKMFDAKVERALRLAEESGSPELQERADSMRIRVQQAWRSKRDSELARADQIVVDRYATSLVLARRFNVSDPSLSRAIRRLAFLTDVIGETTMGNYARTVKDLGYTPGMFLRMRPGFLAGPPPDGLPVPIPRALPGANANVQAAAGVGAKPESLGGTAPGKQNEGPANGQAPAAGATP